MRLLRDLRASTEFLLLLELSRAPRLRQRELAERLEITPQAVSQYLHELRRRGLLAGGRGQLRLTSEGIEYLHRRFEELREFVVATTALLPVIAETEAYAAGSIEPGDSVGLRMERGRLTAHPRTVAPSRGVALGAAERGEAVRVGSLEGIVDLKPGAILLLELPPAFRGGARRLGPSVRTRLRSARVDVAGGLDPWGATALEAAGWPDALVHAPVQSAISAVQRGLQVALVGCEADVQMAIRELEELRAEGREARWRVEHLGEARARRR